MGQYTAGDAAVALMAAAALGGCAGPDAGSDHGRALELVERALEATASAEALAAAGGLVVEAEGVKNAGAEYQGLHPAALSPGEFREILAFVPGREPDGVVVGYEYRHDRYDGTVEAIRERYGPGDQRVIFVLAQGFAVHLESPEHEAAARRLVRRHPGLLLAEVRDRAAGLRYRGRRQGLEWVSASLEGGDVVDLGFEARGGRLRSVEYLTDAVGFGDARIRWRLDDYRGTAAGVLPHSYGVSVSGRPFTEMRVTAVRPGAEAAALLLDPPPGMEVPEPQVVPSGGDPAGGAEVREVAPGVFLVVNLRGGFHPMFIELDEFVVAVDAPAGYPLWDELPASDVAPGPDAAWLSERYLALIRQTVPDKPVRYVAITHFHNDHAGGVRAFVAEGATVMASPSAAEGIRRLVRSPHTLAPDRLARDGGTLDLQVVEDRRVISDGERSVELIDVGANPHTREMLVVRLVGEEIWFVSDLLDPVRVDRFPTPDHAALDRWFAGWLEREGHAPERIYTMHGTGLVTREHLARLDFEAPPKDGGADEG